MGKTDTRRLAGKTALITGGGQGIGRGIALRFVREGAQVALLDRDQSSADSTAAAIVAAGGTALVLAPCDVSLPEQVERAVETAMVRFGAIHILINNAGIAGHSGAFLDLPYERWQELIAVNLSGMFLVGQIIARQMVEQAIEGRIVNLGSINSFGAERGAVAYVVSKAGILGLTRAMAVDLAPHGIRVNCLAPGPITVERNAGLFAQKAPGTARDALRRAIPLARPGTVEETAAAALFLASDEASFITGTTLVVDGGLLAYLALD
jgi:3-oxoacyl-[acyl-carrier protein] reductase